MVHRTERRFAIRTYFEFFACLCILACTGSCTGFAQEPVIPAKSVIDFDLDVRPILSDHCFKCHGPDKAQLQAGLRLDLEANAFEPSDSGETAIVPGKPQASELIRRIRSADADEVMPPPQETKELSQAQIEILETWIEQGATWSNHWAFETVRAPDVPAAPMLAEGAVHNPIDTFVLAKLKTLGLRPTAREEKARLIRRATLDLTGLPPTIAEVDAFLEDDANNAFEKVVDRLLGSQHFGERLAVPWLDLARYGDTSGYHNDSLRDMWLWRAWVIRAFNDNMPFDQFTIEQLAGDMLPNATIEQQIASGFHRNLMTSDEGGLIDAEYRNLYVVDRVATTGVTWLGLTIACAQCHDHKYDPISQRDFYRFYAFFNNVPENGKDGVRDRNPQPFLRVPSEEDSRRLNASASDIASTQGKLDAITTNLSEKQTQWEEQFVSQATSHAAPIATAVFALDQDGQGSSVQSTPEASLASVTGENKTAESTATTLATSTNDTSAGSVADSNVDASPSKHDWLPAVAQGQAEFIDGVDGKGFKTVGNAWFEYNDVFDFSRSAPFSVALYLSVSRQGGSPIGKMDDANGARGWDIEFHGLRPSVHLIHRWSEDAIHVQASQDFPENQWTHLLVTYDGSGNAAGLKMYVDGALAASEIQVDALKGEITNEVPFSIGRRGPSSNKFHGAIDDVRVFERELSASEVSAIVAGRMRAIAGLDKEQRDEKQRKALEQFFQRTQLPELSELRTKLEQLTAERAAFEQGLPNTMVMAELETPRETFIKVRGSYDQDGDKVVAAPPAFLPQIEDHGERLTRLDLAQWLTSPEHPLTARVTVNRWWAMLFGTGLVKTLNDFGSQGERPSNPDLLDWLAADFMQDWDTKRSIKQMVMSATYQQAASVTPELLRIDSENRLLARGPRQRLDAEFLRDNALAIAGVLNPAIGGKSIKPAQPEGTWEINEMSGYSYEKSTGADLYRRGLYVYWRRSTVYPSFVTLDAPTREFCVSQRAKTSTPLQSLVLMNDPVFVEAARGVAQRILTSEPSDQTERLQILWRLALARAPSPAELHVLQQTLERQLAMYRADPDAAKALAEVGDLPQPENLNAIDIAAWTALSNVVLNLNETISN